MPLRVHTSSSSKMSFLSPHHHYIKCTVDQVRHRSSAPSFKCTVVRFYQLFCNRTLAVPNHANHFSSSEIKHMILFLKKKEYNSVFHEFSDAENLYLRKNSDIYFQNIIIFRDKFFLPITKFLITKDPKTYNQVLRG